MVSNLDFWGYLIAKNLGMTVVASSQVSSFLAL